MKICVPTEDSQGLESRLYGHFGSAPFLALVDTETESVEMLENSGHHRDHGQCTPVDRIDADKTDAVMCQGMGRRAIASFKQVGVDVLVTSAVTLRDAIAEVRDGKLRKLTEREACGGRGDGHRHGC
jgi:predicted Fe-Mo cluster-binding NifX family protein